MLQQCPHNVGELIIEVDGIPPTSIKCNKN